MLSSYSAVCFFVMEKCLQRPLKTCHFNSCAEALIRSAEDAVNRLPMNPITAKRLSLGYFEINGASDAAIIWNCAKLFSKLSDKYSVHVPMMKLLSIVYERASVSVFTDLLSLICSVCDVSEWYAAIHQLRYRVAAVRTKGCDETVSWNCLVDEEDSMEVCMASLCVLELVLSER